MSITENAGYSMRVDFDVDWGESTSSIINDKPGEATASLPVSSVVIVTNTTSGRTYPASGDPLDFRVELLYRAVAPNTGKPICGSGIMRFWPGPDGADYCSLPVGGAPAQSFFYGPLASGDSTPNLAPNQLPESSIAAVPESMLAEVLAQLEQPDYVVITAPRWWTTTRCQQNGQSVIASLPAIPGCTD